MKKKWWHEAIIYQVYLRSFKDSNNDGIGDLNGVTERLDYLSDLGVNTIWISPHYDSPMDDNGYDVRDFYKVSKDYGTIDDFKSLLKAAHTQGIKVIIDLILNHTSDEHPWFEAAKDPNHPEHEKYHDFYIWHKPKYDSDGNRMRPTRWVSWFGGPVWEYNPPTDSYYLHIFSKKMPDLNWRNPRMRKELKGMIQWWINLGVDGFRIDASNHLEKNWDFPDGKPGQEHFSSLPRHHEYLEDLGKTVFNPNNMLTIGEAGGASREEALKYAGADSNEFDLLIQFEHCWVDTDDAETLTPGKWSTGIIDLPKIKKSFDHWIKVFKGEGFNVLYWANHDMPRIVSHYGDDSDRHRARSAKMLAYTLYLLPGVPIVYYGEEIGMTNVDYEKLSDFRDVEVFTEYENFINNGATHETAMQALRDRSRDSARSPMQWDDSTYAGFSETKPWMKVNKNKTSINVASQKDDEQSLLQTYKQLLSIRKEEALHYATVKFMDLEHPQTFNYRVKGKTHEFLVLANFKQAPLTMRPDADLSDYELLFHNMGKTPAHVTHFDSYEARIYRRRLHQP